MGKEKEKVKAKARLKKKPPKKTAPARKPKPRSEPTELSFSDLEIPVRPLLTKEEEHRAGLQVQTSLARLSRLLPRHPVGYQRYLARMAEVVAGGGLMFTWLSLRESMAEDLDKASRALDRAEAQAAKYPKRAIKTFEQGVAILSSYPLDPETLYQWSREVARGPEPDTALMRLPRMQRIAKLLRRVVDRLEAARDELVLPNFRLVLKEVFRYHPTGMRRSDLFQEGVLGLHKAVFRYDPGRATRFSTYATYWIRQAIRKSLIDKSRLIRVPQAVQEELRKEKSKLSPEEAERVRRIMSETMLFSAAESDDSGDRNSFVVKDPSTPELGETLHTGVIPQAVAEALKDLSTREREVLQRRFGLGGERPQTLEEIGARMNLSRERIRQIEREALERMRKLPRLQEVYEDLGHVTPVGPASRN